MKCDDFTYIVAFFNKIVILTFLAFMILIVEFYKPFRKKKQIFKGEGESPYSRRSILL